MSLNRKLKTFLANPYQPSLCLEGEAGVPPSGHPGWRVFLLLVPSGALLWLPLPPLLLLLMMMKGALRAMLEERAGGSSLPLQAGWENGHP